MPTPVKDDRTFLKLLLLSLVTFGIYWFWHLHYWTKDINTLCKEDGKSNEGLLLYILLSLVTCGLFPLFWWFKAADRLARAATRESVAVDISGGKVLGFCILGMLTWGIFIWYAEYLVMQATNDLATDYNSKHYADVFEGTEKSHEN